MVGEKISVFKLRKKSDNCSVHLPWPEGGAEGVPGVRGGDGHLLHHQALQSQAQGIVSLNRV